MTPERLKELTQRHQEREFECSNSACNGCDVEPVIEELLDEVAKLHERFLPQPGEPDPLMGIRRAERETGRVLERRECVAILEALGPYFDVEQALLLLAMPRVPEDKTPTPT